MSVNSEIPKFLKGCRIVKYFDGHTTFVGLKVGDNIFYIRYVWEGESAWHKTMRFTSVKGIIEDGTNFSEKSLQTVLGYKKVADFIVA